MAPSAVAGGGRMVISATISRSKSRFVSYLKSPFSRSNPQDLFALSSQDG